ncbi:hypothetical protein [Methanoregula sp.]|jgi:hypothetical protein|uniref:hypothetical protein n=1 Tax=Methanoregula sp. TaxID=2052170 RepID=UPI003C1EFC40
MPLRGNPGITVLVLFLVVLSGCTQPDKTVLHIPVNVSVNITSETPASPLPLLTQTAFTTSSSDTTTVTRPEAQSTPAATLSEPVIPGGYLHYTGADYSLDYPATWGINVTTLPLREYHHTWNGCSVTLAWQLDQELRMYYSGDNSTLFYSSVVNTQRDIWPRDLNTQIDYADIINSILGDPDYCANTPIGAFTISDVTDAPLAGVSYKAIRVDFGKINATGFTEGTGTVYIITGKNRRGVFTFYSSSLDPGVKATISGYMFNSLRLDSSF